MRRQMLDIDLRSALNAGVIGSFSIGDRLSQVKEALSKIVDEYKFWNSSYIEVIRFEHGWYEFDDIEIHFGRSEFEQIILTFFVLKPGNTKPKKFLGGGLFEIKECPIWRGMKLKDFSARMENFIKIQNSDTRIPDTLVFQVGNRGRAIFSGKGDKARFSQIEIL